MPSLDDAINEPAKILLIGDSGAGKTGAKAALVALGYKLRMIDTDKGARILRGLLTDPRYPYAEYMKQHNIVPDISYIPIDVPIDFTTVQVYDPQLKRTTPRSVLAPTDSKAWATMVGLLKNWKDGDRDLGSIEDWDQDTILDFDTLSTLATMAQYWVQDINGRLGSLNDEHGRDTGGAQEMLRRLLMKVTSSSVRCNVIVTTHVTRADVSQGAAQSPGQLLRENRAVDPKGFPAAIGRALSPQIGKFFNDCYVVQSEVKGGNVSRTISSIPIDNTMAKNSVWLEKSYPVDTGLAQIFSALRFKEPPADLMKATGNKATGPSNSENGPVDAKPKGFGR